MAKNKVDNELIATPANLRAAARQMGVYPQQSTADQNEPQITWNAQKMTNSNATNPVAATGGGAMTQTQNANGVNTGGGNRNVMTQQNVPYSGDLQGVRASLNNMGIGNDAIGWDGKNVTIGGQAYITPQNVTDGVSYTDRQSIQKAANQYYDSIGKPLEEATSYVASTLGVENAVTWSDGNMMIGGQIVPTVYVDDDGTAYAHRADIDKAISAYRDRTGLKSNQDVVNDWKDRYDGRIQQALDDFTNRKAWSYDMENDPAYRAYRDQYIREGDRAYQNAYANMAAATSGYGSSAAMNAAGQQWNYYMQQLGDRIPQLQQNDYNRYLGEYDLRRQALDSLRNVANDDYEREYNANRDTLQDLNAANEAAYQRRLDARKLNRADMESDRLWDMQEPIYRDKITQSGIDTENYRTVADLDIEASRQENEARRLALWEQQASNILTKYRYSNPDTPISREDAEAIGIQPKADGTYPSVREVEKNYDSIERMLQQMMFDEVTWPQMVKTYQLNNGLLGM